VSGHILEIGDGLTALANTYAVDGRVSWHSPSVRGFAAVNCYLLQVDEDALLIDTGVGAHRTEVVKQVGTALRQPANLAIFTLRQGEFDSIGNLLPLVHAFEVKTLYGQFTDMLNWGDFLPAFDMTGGWEAPSGAVESTVVPRLDTLCLGRGDRRRLAVFRPLLRLLSTHWVYDEATRTLFTSDSFSYIVRDAEAGPWRVTEEDDDVTVDHVSEHLVATRYWWMAQSNLDDLRRDLAETFDRYDVEHIAPAFGAVLSGSSVVQRHVQLMDQSMAELGRSSSAVT
jgi:flavorubredoxin